MKKYIILIVIILVIVGGGIYYFQKNNSTSAKSSKQSTSITNSICDNISNQFAKKRCYIYEAMDTQDKTICDKLGDISSIQNCKNKVSAGLKNCDSQPNDYTKMLCISENAAIKNNPGLCETIQTSLKNVCYKNYAIGRLDSDYCEKIIKRDSTNLTEKNVLEEKDSCYGSVATQSFDIESCKKVIYENLKTTCLNFIEGY